MNLARWQHGAFDLRVLEAGDGPAVLWLHGFEQHPGSASYLERLATTRRVIAPELPGFGSSTGFEAIHDVVDVALLLRALIEERADGRVDVIGHCLGGMFAAEIAALFPHVVRRLVLVNAYGLWLDAAPSPNPFGLTPPQLAKAKWHDPSADRPRATTLQDHPDDPIESQLYHAGNLASATKFLWPLPDRGLSRRLPYVHAPTLILHGSSDGLVPAANADAAAELIADARVLHIANAGHEPMVEQADAFFAALNTFLD